MKIKKKNKSGLSLVEILISSVIFLIMMGMITNFLFGFTRYSNNLTQKNNLNSQLRTANLRLESEIDQCSAVLFSYTPPAAYGGPIIYTNENRLILTRKVVHKVTSMPDQPNPKPNGYDPKTNTNYNDVIIIDYTGNGTTAIPATTVKTGKILYSRIPAPSVTNSNTYYTSKRIIKQGIISGIVNSASDTIYTTWAPSSPEPSTAAALHPFRFYNYKSGELFPASGVLGSADAPNVSLIEVTLFGRKEEGIYKPRQNTDSKITLRN